MSIDESHHRIAATLIEALPYMRRFKGETFVVKFGGHAMGSAELTRDFARDVVLLKQVGMNPIVVHGGGPQIKALLDKLAIQSSFVDGLRVTDAATVEVVEMVLAGKINKEIVAAIHEAGGRAVGLSGKDGKLLRARKLHRTKRDPGSSIEQILDLGFVGEPDHVDTAILDHLVTTDAIPVIAPVGFGEDGHTYNINADTAAGAIAAAVQARKLFMLTDVAGVLDGTGELIKTLTLGKARMMIQDGTIHGGMIPKVETCLAALEEGVRAAYIVDGRVPHAILLEVFTEEGVGTELLPGDRKPRE
ncbi:MAG: acetylglutamate kinase [Geminicoccaceae bacterium]|nr:MAG: acetylglutamate kinase [Geminicoccaceae bacterium]